MDGGTTSISGEIAAMEASAKEVDAEVVPIDQLEGEVYAVQIGAFSEDSDQSWLKKFNGSSYLRLLREESSGGTRDCTQTWTRLGSIWR